MTRPTHLWSLVKPRIVGLLCLTGVTALFAAGGAPPVTVAGFVVAGALVAAGSAAANCYYDRDLDRHMERTADRPLPGGDLAPRTALAFTLALFAAGTAVGLATLPLAAVGHMWLGVASYVGLYTVGLKRRHWTGVVLGGSAGSFPVLAGWSVVAPVGPAAVLGSSPLAGTGPDPAVGLAAAPVVMATVVFAWTPAHAWALAFVYRDDFAAAGVPTLPAVADAATVRRAVWYAALSTVAVAAAVAPLTGPVYTATAAAGSPLFLLAFWAFRRAGTEATAVRAFFSSNCYLAALFVAWAVGAHVSPGPAGMAAVAAATLAAFGWLWSVRPALRGVESAPAPSVRVLAAGARTVRAAVSGR